MSHRADKMLKYFKEHKTYMEDRVNAGIELYRKGIAKFNFVDADGNAVTDVQIKLSQKTHDFRFGANIFMLNELETDEKNEEYKKRFAEVFNLATLPFYWCDLEPEQGKPRFTKDSPKVYRRPAPDLCLEYCAENDIEPKLHCLNYDQWTPHWVPNDVETVKKLLYKRIKEIAERYGDNIPSMEVVNESLHSHNVYDERRHSTLFFREPDFVEWGFEQARKFLPTTKLIINEATPYVWQEGYKYNRSAYYSQIERAIANGTSIDSIGMQYHSFNSAETEDKLAEFIYNPKQIYDVMDTYSDFNKPLQITEVTIPAYSGELEDEQIQAEIISNLYKIWFSHPNMEAIIYWNLVDGYAFGATPGDMTYGENYFCGGLLHFDLTPKPAYETIRKLIKDEWHTELEAACGATFETKGFYGNYDVEVIANGKTVKTEIHIEKDAKNKFTITI